MKYRLIKMFIVLFKISDYNMFLELTVQGLRHYWFLRLRTYRFAFLYYYQTQRGYLHSKRIKPNLDKYAFLNSSRNSLNCIQYLC
jgi:hypothetical protein